jgi:hypothetical protein
VGCGGGHKIGHSRRASGDGLSCPTERKRIAGARLKQLRVASKSFAFFCFAVVQRTVCAPRGKRLGRPPSCVDADKVADRCAQGASWRAIARELGVGV